MKTFFFMGPNPKNKTGVSWKIWKIAKRHQIVTLMWGPACLYRRNVIPAGTLQRRVRRFPSIQAATEYEHDRIKNKLRKGYKRMPRRHA